MLIDSGAYSELTGAHDGVDLSEYTDYCAQWADRAEACAALDDITGNWRRSLKNLEQGPPMAFPTYHDSDPVELLPELISAARERGQWLGIGLVPPRHQRERWLETTLEQIPSDIHVHGWAMRAYKHMRQWHTRASMSMDSTNWWRDAMYYRRAMPFLTFGEALKIVVKRYKREQFVIKEKSPQGELFG